MSGILSHWGTQPRRVPFFMPPNRLRLPIRTIPQSETTLQPLENPP